MPFRPPLSTVGEQLDKKQSSCRIKIINTVILSFQLKPRDSALKRPLVRVSHVLEWAYPLNSRRWRGKWLHHGGDVCVLCLASKKLSEREFLVPAGTDLAVKLLTK